MKIVRIINRRNGLATNSSSTHSVIYKNKGEVFEDLNIFDERYYDRCTETIAASREAKIRYIFGNIFRNTELVELLSERYPEMKQYYPMVKDYYEKYKDGAYDWREHADYEDYNFGDHCRGELYNNEDIFLSYQSLCNIIDSPDLVIIGGSDELDFVYDTIEGHTHYSFSDFRYMDNIVEKVKNGNYYIVYGERWGRKEKARLAVEEGKLCPESPELVDIKITNACEHGCPFCYMNSTPNGKHAELRNIYRLINVFHKKTEFALGGGNVLLHPEFDKIVKYIDNNHIANITIRYDDIKTIYSDEKIERAIDKYVSGIGISVQKASDVDAVRDFIYEMLKKEKHVALHIIPEMIGVNESVAIINKMNEINDTYHNECSYDNTMKWGQCKVLFLGLKCTGRAKTLEHNLLSSDDLSLLYRVSNCSFCVDTSFVNTYSDWFKSKYYDNDNLFLTRHEGEYSMFIDAVKMKAYTSSYKDDGGIDICDNDGCYKSIDILFGEIRKKNGFQVFEKLPPYYRR
jgi:hypothetical protein